MRTKIQSYTEVYDGNWKHITYIDVFVHHVCEFQIMCGVAPYLIEPW